MVYGVIAIIVFAGIILYLDYRICRLERKIQEQKVMNDLLIYDFLKRNKKNIKGIKIDKDALDELFK